MPALQQEYDYYEYARRKQGAVKRAVPNSAVTKNTRKAASSVQNRSPQNRTMAKSPQSITLKTSTTRDVTKNATRMAMRGDFIDTPKKNTRKVASSAVKTKGKPIEESVIRNKKKANTYAKPQEMSLKKPKVNKSVAEQKAKVKATFKHLVVSVLLFGMFFLICYRYSYINEAFSDVGDVKADLKEKKTINAQLESNIQKNTDLAYIENYAKYQLGMQKPKDSQIQKITVKKYDKITTPIEIKEEEEESLFRTIINDIVKILD